MNRPLRICFVAPFAYLVLAGDRSVKLIGGSEVQQSLIACELVRRGHDVSMISMDYGQREGDRVQGVRLLKMHAPAAGLPGLRFLHPRLTSVWSAMKRADADVYYQMSAGALTAFVAAFARRHGKRSVFAAAHDLDFDRAPLIEYARDRLLYRWGVRTVSEVIVQTPRQQRLCRERFGREAALINSVYADVGKPARHDGVVLWAATVKPHKQAHLFVELARRMPQFRFKLVGGADESSAAYNEAVRREGAALRNIEFTGFLPFTEADRHFDGASIFVNTSVGEGFPNTFLQAWSRGTPTVSFFDAAAIHEGRSVGLVVKDVDEMQRTVHLLKEQHARWADTGARARRYCQENHRIGKLIGAYERVIETPPISFAPS